MTKQDKIRECIEMILQIAPVPLDDVGNVASTLLDYLRSQGVVIKVDRELPETPRGDPYDDYCNGYIQAQEDMLEAGYVATESLIEEAQDVAVSM
uniref:Uncharacterized protein n=1 Tax=viral metagenome TaxID=1070528 RepID=A0A6M3LRP6_9ZZZZ